MNKIDFVTREVVRIVDDNVKINWIDILNKPLTEMVFNRITGRHELECFFAIEFEQEQVDAWATVQNIIDDVMNLWVSPITDPITPKRGIVGEVAPEAIMPPFRMENGQMILNEVALPKIENVNLIVTTFKDGKLFVNDVEVPESKIYRTEPLTQSEAINRIERADVERFATCRHGVDTLNYYQSIATKSAIYPGKGTPFGLMYAALGLAEAGEVQNKVKKAFRDDGVISFHPIDKPMQATVTFQPITPERRAQIIKELGGVLWYIAAVCDEIGATMSEVALTNLDELCGRGERNTLRGDGDNR